MKFEEIRQPQFKLILTNQEALWILEAIIARKSVLDTYINVDATEISFLATLKSHLVAGTDK